MIKLINFISDRVRSRTTSIGPNKAIPCTVPEGDVFFLTDILTSRWNEIASKMGTMYDKYNISDVRDFEYFRSKMITRVQKLEKEIRPQLEKICRDIIGDIFSIPNSAIIFDCHIVSEIKNDTSKEVMPKTEDIAHSEMEMNGRNYIYFSDEEVLKRRMIDCLIMGASYELSAKKYFYSKIKKINPQLLKYYDIIRSLDDFTLFLEQNKFTELNKKEKFKVTVTVNHSEVQSTIDAQGTTFAYLLFSSIHGFMEFFASHGLPSDSKKAKAIIEKADFFGAEPFDMRIGVPLWNKLYRYIRYSKLVPYVFKEICSKPCDEFNVTLSNAFSGNGNTVSLMSKHAKNDLNYDKFKLKMIQKIKKSLMINDEYMKNSELDDIFEEVK